MYNVVTSAEKQIVATMQIVAQLQQFATMQKWITGSTAFLINDRKQGQDVPVIHF